MDEGIRWRSTEWMERNRRWICSDLDPWVAKQTHTDIFTRQPLAFFYFPLVMYSHNVWYCLCSRHADKSRWADVNWSEAEQLVGVSKIKGWMARAECSSDDDDSVVFTEINIIHLQFCTHLHLHHPGGFTVLFCLMRLCRFLRRNYQRL